jgi:hypothetical protein
VVAGGTRLEDIELQRQDEAWLNALGAKIIPDREHYQFVNKMTSNMS